VFHDLAQARTRYGQQAETVINSHRARMLLPGVADLDTLRYFSGLLGEQVTRDQTINDRARVPNPLGEFCPPAACPA
jgi:type IV secretory pathway TraG/TraD family ATPase VirD4